MRQSAHSVQPNTAWSSVKALVFDVFGTVVDWRTSVAQEVETRSIECGIDCGRGRTRRLD